MISLHQTLSVSAIKNGTVIDHIPAGQALRIMRLLKLADAHQQITLGLNLVSKTLQQKDLIKIENKQFTEDEVDRISLLAPQATINIIEQFKVIEKIKNHLPNRITKILRCLNQNCVTHSELLLMILP